MYWSDTASIYRVPLNGFHLSSTQESCASDTSSKVALINNAQLETFTVEPNEAIYFIGYDSCFDDPSAQRRTNRSILGTTLNAGDQRVYTGSTDPVVSADSFDRTLFSSTNSTILAVDATQVATCPEFPPILLIHFTESPVLVLRVYRSVKQPLPGKIYVLWTLFFLLLRGFLLLQFHLDLLQTFSYTPLHLKLMLHGWSLHLLENSLVSVLLCLYPTNDNFIACMIEMSP